ncbi:type IX secretion system membrane protein PorP/SprF [Parapedobacter pyrenivorans]|uniref:type IX secretion system membrane protein PorP/SprF n=1 Tax=Parapedobacter pyrenivorans TaxID=1305674 RepID=UPI0016670D7C|nr:type IX secretion system membrane protein PorP/SprF [Parapedobacter pyrenivorans]
MYTRSTYIFLLFLCTASLVWAQQRPQYTQYIFNGFLMNPAVAGIERYVDVKLRLLQRFSEDVDYRVLSASLF